MKKNDSIENRIPSRNKIILFISMILILTGVLLICVGMKQNQNAIKVPILMYHHFEEVGDGNSIIATALFEEHMETLHTNGYNTISFDELIEYVNTDMKLPENPVLITMDDGYASNYDIAFPVFKEYDMKATIFVIGVSMGKDYYKDTEYEMYPHFGFDEAREMVNTSLISIQSHTYDMHQWTPYEDPDSIIRTDMLQLSDESEEEYIDAILRDFSRSKTEIEEELNKPVNVLAYPLGRYSDISERILKEQGVQVTLSTQSGINMVKKGEPETLYKMKRYAITDAVTSEMLLKMLEGKY